MESSTKKLEEAQKRISQLKKKNTLLEDMVRIEKAKLKDTGIDKQKQQIFESITSSLSLTDKQRLKSLTSSLEYKTETQYEASLKQLAESYNMRTSDQKILMTEDTNLNTQLTEETDQIIETPGSVKTADQLLAEQVSSYFS